MKDAVKTIALLALLGAVVLVGRELIDRVATTAKGAIG